MHCKDCLFRNESGECDSPYFSDYLHHDNGIAYQYSEGGSFIVGDFFGCIHFENKE